MKECSESKAHGDFEDNEEAVAVRGVLIVRGEDARKVVSLLKELGAEVHVRTVKLTAEDRKELGL